MKLPFNELFRASFFKEIWWAQEVGIPFEEEIKCYQDILYRMQCSNDPYQKLFWETRVALFYLDTYKLIHYNILKNTQTFGDLELFSTFSTLEDFDDILSEASSNPQFLKTLMEHCYRFAEKTFLGKALIMKSLLEQENRELSEIIPLHQEEVTYFSRLIDASDLSFFYHQMNVIVGNERYENYDLNHVIDNMRGFLKEISLIDRASAENIFREIIQKDYEWSKYLLTAHSFPSKFLELEAQDRIDLVEQEELTLSNIIDSYLKNDDLLISLLNSFVDIEEGNFTQNQEITQKDIDQYRDLYISPKIKRKLKKETT